MDLDSSGVKQTQLVSDSHPKTIKLLAQHLRIHYGYQHNQRQSNDRNKSDSFHNPCRHKSYLLIQRSRSIRNSLPKIVPK